MRSYLLRGTEHRIRRYVLGGSFERHCDQGFQWMGYAALFVIVFAVLIFGPVCLNIFMGR
jgi:hypothetical protein